MKSIHLTKHPDLLKNSFTEIRIHSDYWRVNENFEVYSYTGAKERLESDYITSVQLVAKETKLLDKLTRWDSYTYNDVSIDVLKQILKNRFKNAELLLFDVMLFSTYEYSNKFLKETHQYYDLFKDLRTPVKL